MIGAITTTQFLATTLIVMALVLIFLASFLLNKKTPKPVEIKISASGCKACGNYTCSHKSEYKGEE